MKSFRMTVRIANNQMRERREELGLSQGEAARLAGVHIGAWNGLESLRDKPVRPVYEGFGTGRKAVGVEWRPAALSIAACLGVEPETLWPEEVQQVTANRFEVSVDGPELLALADYSPPGKALDDAERSAAIEAALRSLPPREERVLRLRFGLTDDGEAHTQDSIAKAFNRSKQLISTLEQRALRRLMQPRHGKSLKEHA